MYLHHTKYNVLYCYLCFSDFGGEESPFGPLTQRLVSALLEENVITAADEDAVLGGSSGGTTSSADNSNSQPSGKLPAENMLNTAVAGFMLCAMYLIFGVTDK